MKKYPVIEISPKTFAQINGYNPNLIMINEVESHDDGYAITLNSICLRGEEVRKLLEILEAAKKREASEKGEGENEPR